ncbi:tetratricopeptide repeat 8 [Brachionus plicatilis]|uniref:Tetratricopeptide repeat 8 n=1 Tax=Brachionus plicatilis TaxID=10195 RepID=A0A3M7RQ08_BRAPC|nr:tetratricopeptide repeat 8 [Brachionus plicatilis]
MDPLFMACSLFRRRKFDECTKICSQILEKNPYDQSAWVLKMRALSEQVYIDEVEIDDDGIAEMLDENAVAQVSRPGTSLRGSSSSQNSLSMAMRPVSQSGRPLSGAVRPGSQSNRPGTMEQAIRTPRSAYTARPLTSSSARFVRLGTASMLSSPDQFINLSRLNFTKYAETPSLAKPLFEYIFYHENDVRNALQMAALATEACQFNDWWWKVQLGKCYYRLGLFREAEKQFISALKQNSPLDVFLYLSKIYVKLDQPLNSINRLKEANQKFPFEVSILQGMARVYEAMGDMGECMKYYREVLQTDSTNVEAIACIATNYFYNDQPEVALKFYRRLLQMGVYNSEIFNNIGLCCFYAQQYDLILSCFERALSLATNDMQIADIWYNLGHVALGVGDSSLAYQCFRLCLVSNNDSVEAYNNLGVLEMAHGRNELAKSFFQASQSLGSNVFEPNFNNAYLAHAVRFRLFYL